MSRPASHTTTLCSLLVLSVLSACSKEAPSTQQLTESKTQTSTQESAAAKHKQDADAATTQPATIAPPPPPAEPMRANEQVQNRAVAPTGSGVAAPKPAAPVAMAMPMPIADQQRPPTYGKLEESAIKRVSEAPVSTFSIDVDSGAYSNVRRMLNSGQSIPKDAVRIEELVNYFPYDYPLPRGNQPFAVHTELVPSPWHSGNLVLRIGLQAADPAKDSLPPANLVLLVDTSGSMHVEERLPLVRRALPYLVEQLRPQDKLTLITYAGYTQVLLEPTPGDQKAKILNAINNLQAQGSTNGASGIQLAYAKAQEGLIKDGINRILLLTDGDFNVGVTDFDSLKRMVEEGRRSKVGFSTVGVGIDGYNEHLMEQLADAGDGKYSYFDSLAEAQKVLSEEYTSTLATVAKDVKIQVEFNPAQVSEYRLIGYENRVLRNEDFRNDKVDAGEIGAGHSVTALYELTPAGVPGALEPLRYQSNETSTAKPASDELAFVKLRFKRPDQDVSEPLEVPVLRSQAAKSLNEASAETRFAMAVAGFGELLRGGRYSGSRFNYDNVQSLARAALGEDRFGYRHEFVRLIELARRQQPVPSTAVKD